ncbi:hypothetical protein [Mycobacterium sp. ITM-2016-00318]|uniref:hypothetical protein n=1 Tax=Mycobacterium sp. ITM-2016-00318 TaxID=2099693 RepID=UPI001159E0BE|nr:hypothetical protein [Mycobacterium sp. ITM-2016-00318]WNG92039.1 hypothetical protein C6A82_021770 [Mycobacterium sp. ITM-2016-00318]
MEATRTNRQKLMEWVRRYLPNELAGWAAGELGAATAYVNGVRCSYAAHLLAVRSQPIEEVDGEPVAAVAVA